ncbi:hypothetical protein NW762_010625 [Fusarium torreyae]|uniref:Protein kinase domain-containing protein n=1 Tax=Fusarium torreyae TaxID=1237075 RepID=A0A9W8VBJ4_9HYPO|nr:hypothetical protein NW762_010625 [Fusarium torreyae]
MQNLSVESGSGPYTPHIYSDDSEIPFAPDGNAPLISPSVEKVKGTAGQFCGLKCVRKTIIDNTEADEALQLAKKRRIVQEAKVLHYAKHHHIIKLIHTYFMEEKADRIVFSVIMDCVDANFDDFLKPGNSPKF